MKQISKRLENSLARIRKCGGVVLVHHTSAGSVDFTLPNGREVAGPVIAKLREAGVLVSGADGLFGGDEQTLHAVAA